MSSFQINRHHSDDCGADGSERQSNCDCLTAPNIKHTDQDKIESIVNGIVRRLENSGETEIKTSIIGQLIMDSLLNIDQVAYVRFASVYKNFREARDFEDFLGNLEDK